MSKRNMESTKLQQPPAASSPASAADNAGPLAAETSDKPFATSGASDQKTRNQSTTKQSTQATGSTNAASTASSASLAWTIVTRQIDELESFITVRAARDQMSSQVTVSTMNGGRVSKLVDGEEYLVRLRGRLRPTRAVVVDGKLVFPRKTLTNDQDTLRTP